MSGQASGTRQSENTGRSLAASGMGEGLSVFVLLWILTYMASFILIRGYGVYYDDFYSLKFSEKHEMFAFWKPGALAGSYGRPLFVTVRSLFFNLLNLPHAGLLSLYCIDFLLQTAIAFAWYLFLRRRVSPEFAVIAAILFVVFPAFTCQQYLTNAVYELSILGVIVVWQLYSAGSVGSVVLSYLVFGGLVLYYELLAPLCYAAPLMSTASAARSTKRMLFHVVTLTAILVVLVGCRRYVAEPRLAGDTGEFQLGLMRYLNFSAITIVALGIRTSVGMFIGAPLLALGNWRPEMTFLTVGAFPILLLYVRWIVRGTPEMAANRTSLPVRLFGREILVERYRLRLIQYIGIGVVLTVLGYLFTPFMHAPSTSITGRETRVHMAAMLGVSCSLAAIWCLLFGLFKSRSRARSFLAITFAAYLSLIVAYRFLIQSDYETSWQIQRAFWTKVLELVPDLDQQTVVVAQTRGFPRTYFVDSFYCPMGVLVPRLLKFPAAGPSPRPRSHLFVIHQPLSRAVNFDGGRLLLDTGCFGKVTLDDGNVIALEMGADGLMRKTGAVPVAGGELHLKPPDPDRHVARPGYFFEYITTNGRQSYF